MNRLILWAFVSLLVFAYSTKTAALEAAVMRSGIAADQKTAAAAGDTDHKKIHTAFDVPEANGKSPKAQAVKAGSMKQQLGNQVKSKRDYVSCFFF